jgi:hypothetical protein
VTVWERSVCPVCRRLVAISPNSGLMRAHADKAGYPCPMSGREAA